jgi:hypothetical protein
MPTTLDKAREFTLLNARLLDRQRFAYHFEGGASEPVLAALHAYQNADGGFGNALEPDKRCPESQPVDTQVALQVLDSIDAFDDPMVSRACDFLMSISTDEGGVPYVLPSVNNYPHTPWWTTGDNPPASLNPTAGIVALLLKHNVNHHWVAQAEQYCWKALEKDDYMGDYHVLSLVISFLQHAHDQDRARKELDRITAYLPGSDLVALDPGAEGYVQTPLDWAPAPDNFLRPLFSDDVIARHLDALASSQQEDGGWPIKWETVSAAAETEWRGWVTVENLKTLSAYAALDR